MAPTDSAPSSPRVRPATDADAPAVRALQSLLSEPAPRLLAVGLAAGDVLVSTAPPADAPVGGSDDDTPGGVPVGYLLSVGGSDGGDDESDGDGDEGGDGGEDGGGDGGDDASDNGDGGADEGDGDRDGGGAGDGDRSGSGDPAVHVAELAVAPARRREGRASELLRTLCGALPPDARVTITVEPSNRAARACYESLGFEATARREGYFESGPAVVYERRAGGKED